MVYVYAKKDKNKEKAVFLGDAVKFKSLWNKAEKIETELRNYFLSGNNLMFSGEEEETKRCLYKAIDCLKSFRDNLKLKDKYEVEE